LAYVLAHTTASLRLPELGVLVAVISGMSSVIAFRMPRFPLAAALAYAGSPLSFYIVFRDTSSSSPYPAAHDLSIDAAVALGLLSGAIVPLLLRRELRPRRSEYFLLALGALSAAWILTAFLGLARGNAATYVVTDLIPVAEVVLAYLAVTRLYTRPAQLRPLFLSTVVSLAVTAFVRLGFYPFGIHGFGVTQQPVGSRLLPRLFLIQPYAWLMPLCVVYYLTARTRRRRLLGSGLAVLFGTCALLSFERGTWVILGCAILPLLAVILWKRPRVAATAVVIATVASVALAATGKGSYNPIQLVAHRLAYTRTQVFDPNEPLQHKRSDETRAILRAIRHHPENWLAGAGLGATYVGPTGFRDVGYQQSFKRKHYSFNTYLAVALRSGALGLIALALLVLAMLNLAWRSARSAQTQSLRLVGAAAFGGTVALVGVSVVDPELLIHPLAIYLGATFGLLTLPACWAQMKVGAPE
jgi:O-antigen ligase